MKLFATVNNEQFGNAVKKVGDKYLQIKLHYHNRRYATIGWNKESNSLCIYGYNKQKIKCFSAEELGHKDYFDKYK